MKQGYKNTEIGVIPVEWEVISLGDKEPYVTSGSRGWATHYSDSGNAYFVRITNMSRDSIYLDLAVLKELNLDGLSEEGTRTKLNFGDILVSITADIGIVSFFENNVDKPAYINQHIALIRLDLVKVDTKFVAYFLASPISQQIFKASTDGGAKAGMNLTGIRNIKCAFPPLPEQRAIASALSDIDALLAAQDRLISKKRDLKTASMQALLSGKQRLPGFAGADGYKNTEIGVIPEDWEVRDLGTCVNFRTGPFGSMLHKSDYVSGGVPVINPMHIFNRKIFPENGMSVSLETAERMKDFTFNVDDVAIGRRGEMGRCALIKKEQAGWICGTGTMIIRSNGSISEEFLTLFLSSKLAIDFITQMSVGSTMINLNQGILSRLPIPRPPLDEQRAIARVLSDMDAEIEALEAQRDKTAQIKQGMMQELLTGKTRLV